MPARLPLIPGARRMSVPFSSCCPSGREIRIDIGLKAPALVLLGAALKLGAKGRSAIVFAHLPPPGALVNVKPSPGIAGRFPDQGVITVTVSLGPQVGGLLRTARGPPLRVNLNEVNGTCGVSAKVVVSWPVIGLALTLPISRTEIPYLSDLASTKIRYSLPEVGSRLSCLAT